MKVNGKSKTPITDAQSKNSGEKGGAKARTSQPASKNKLNGVKSAVLERISDGILALDAGMNYTYLNERAGELLGRSADELVGKNLQEEFPAGGRTPFMEACQRALETQSVVWLNEYFPPTDRWLEGRVYPSADGVSVLFTEGTAQKAVEMENHYRILVDSMQEAFLLAEIITDENGESKEFRFIDINPAMEGFLGKKRSEVIGHTLREIFPQIEDEREVMKRIAHVGLGAEPFFVEEYSVALQRWYRAHFFSPRPGQVAGLAFDITESKKAEERVREVSMFPEQNPNPVMRLTREGTILYANQASAPLLATWMGQKERAVSFLQIREQLPAVIETGSNREIEIENQGSFFTCLLVPFPEQGYVNLYFRDITERKKAEDALHAIVNQASAGIARTDPQGRFTFVNQALCDMLGYSEAELIHMTVWDITDGGLLEKSRRLFERLVTTGEGYHLEKRLIRRNGSILWVNAGVSPMQDVEGNIQGTTFVMVDITRRKRAEESLLDHARRSLFLSSLSDTIRSIDSPSKIQIEAACLLGAHLKASCVAYMEAAADGSFLIRESYVEGVEEVPGRISIQDFLPEEQLSKFRAGRVVTWQDVQDDPRFSDRQRSELEALSARAQIILPLTRGGKVVAALWVQQSQPRAWREEEISLVEEAAERTQGAVERAQAEQKLRDSEKRFRILSNAVPSIVWTSTPDGRLQFVNDRWYDFTGLPRQEEAPLWTDLKLHPDDAQHFFQEMRAVKSAQTEAVVEARIRQYDGSYRWFQTRSVPTMDENGNITAWHGVLTDIHNRVEKDAEQRKIIDGTPFMLARCSRDLRYLFVSRAYAEMLHLTPEQVIGRSILEVMGGKGLKSILPYIERVLQGERLEFETSVPLEFGNSPYLHVDYTPDRDEQGNVIGWFASIIDLTERRQMEESLRESERKFNIIFNKLPFTATLMKPNDNVIVDVNEEFETVFGYTRQEAIGKTTFELDIASRPEDRAYILAQLQSSVAIRDMELELHTRQRGPRLFLVNTDLVTIGGSQYILQTAQDITERRQAEKATQASEEKYRRIVDTANEGIWEIDRDTKTIFVNTRMAEMLGYTVQEMIGRSAFEFVFPEDHSDGEQRIARAKRGVGVRSNEFKYRRKDGSAVWVLVSSSPQLDKQGNFIGSIAMTMDITERKQQELALRASEESLRLAIESNRMVAWEWDPQTDIVTTSKNFSEVYGLSSVSKASEGFALIWPQDLPVHRQKVDQVMEQGGEYRSEFRITRPVDGRTLWLEERGTALTSPEGQVTRLVGVVLDISERKRAEQEMAEYTRQQAALFKLADQFNSAASLQDMFSPALDAILSALQCDRASILLFDDQDVMRFVAWRGLSDAYRQATDGHSPWKKDEKNARPVILEDVATADLEDWLRDVIEKEGIGALAFIPLVSRGRLIGKFMIYFNQPHPFDEAEIELGQTIAHQLATNIERKRAEEALRQSKQRLALTYHHAPIGIVETTLDGRFIEVNSEICKLLGYSYDELVHLGIAEVTHPEDLESDLGQYHRLVNGELPFYRIEKRFIKKGGGVLWAEVVRAMVYDEVGTPLYGIGGILDITERKQKAEELRAKTEEVEALMEVSPIGIFFAYDADCSKITANPAGYHLVGMPENSTVNLSLSAPDNKQNPYRMFRNGAEVMPENLPMQTAARLGMEIEEETLELRFQDGTQKYVYIYAKPLFDVHGNSRGAISAMLDITQRMQREEELRARTEEIEALMEVSPIAMLVAHDPECNNITGNPAAKVLLGLPANAEENLSNPALAVKGPAHWVYRDGVQLAVQDLPMQMAARLGIEIKDETLEMRFEDGTQKYIYLYAKPLFNAQNRSRGAIAAMLDVTERRKNEQALRESEERFSRFMHHLPGLAWIKDIQGRYVFANAAARKAFNVPQDQLYGKTDWDIFPGEIAAQFNKNDDLAVTDEKGVQVVETLPQPDGMLHHSLVTKFPIPGSDGNPALIGGTAFDITERIQMEDALRVARADAEKTAYRVTQLQKTTAALSQVLTPMQVATLVVEEGAKVLGAAGSTVMLFNEEAQTLEMLYSSLPGDVRQSFTRFPLSLKVPHTDAIRAGRPVWISSREEYIERYPHLADLIQRWDYQAAIVAPMEYKGRILGGLSMSFDRPLPYSIEDQEYLMTLARQAAQAFERARIDTTVRLDAAMMENVFAGIYLVSASEGTILHTNPQLDKLFGYEPGEIIGKPVSILNAPNGKPAEEVAAEIIGNLREKGTWQGEVLSRRKDGTSFWCYASITTFEHDTHGTVWVAARQDITERKQMEEALRDSEQRYRAIVSQATAGIVRKDESGRLLFVNQEFCDMLGYTDSELLGRPIWELTHDEDAEENKRLYDRLMAEGIPFHLEKRLIHKDGSILWTNVSVSPVVDMTGRPHSAVSVYVDITGRRLAEDRLALLTTVSELARQFEEPDELMFEVSRAVGEHFRARRTLFNEIDLENDLEIVHRDYCRGVDSVAGTHPISDYSSITTAEMMAGKTVVNHDSKLDPRTAPDYEKIYVTHGERSYVAVPLMHDGYWVASLWISDDKPREWDEEDVSLLETIAERTWIAIEKMRVDRALQDSEERLRVTLNTTVVGFATLTPETYFEDMNEAFCRIVGYSRQELLKMNSEQLTHPDFIGETRRNVGQLLNGEAPYFTVEKIYIRRDGTEIWVQNSVSIVRDENGKPLHLITICQDITDRKRSEKALQESNQRYQTLVEISPYAIFVNRDERIVFANNECIKMLGAESPEQIIGKSNFDILHPDYHDVVRERIKLMAEGHQNVPALEEKIVRLDGQTVDVEISASPFIEQGEPAILVTMNDITERKRAEEALHQLNLELEERVRRRTVELQAANEFLRESEATSRLILESMPDAIVIIDRDGQIVHANTQVETLFGYAPGEVMGQPVETLVPQRLRTEHEQQRSSYAEERNRRIMGLGHEL
ncbi:MAG: PAS domain S-box protein, partial [Syntrophothermus sp.]